jgi:hypothetical protein
MPMDNTISKFHIEILKNNNSIRYRKFSTIAFFPTFFCLTFEKNYYRSETEVFGGLFFFFFFYHLSLRYSTTFKRFDIRSVVRSKKQKHFCLVSHFCLIHSILNWNNISYHNYLMSLNIKMFNVFVL